MGLCTTGNTSSGTRAKEQFSDPFQDIASMAFPDTIQEANAWCERIVLRNGPYREALNRVISYFITDIEVVSQSKSRVGSDEKKKYEDFLNDVVGIKDVLHRVALDYLVYGNSFTSLIVPFRRYLSCPKEDCGFEAPLRKVYNTPSFQFQWRNFEFHAKCPCCGHHGEWKHVDRRSGESGAIKVKRWSPYEIDIIWDDLTDDCDYIWKIPQDYRQKVIKGHLHTLERASWELVQAVKENQHLLFDEDAVYHMKEGALAGIRSRGWGVSRVLTNFSQAYYVQVLHRYNEAIAMDYVIPFRVITPATRGGTGESGDPALTMNMGAFSSRVARMLRDRRQDPARWNVLPFPVEYQALGGDATQLAPKDLIELGVNDLLNATGVPVELYKGNLSAQSAPAMLRLFEATWAHLLHHLNRFLDKLTDKVAKIMSWEPITCRLQRVTHADDLNRQMAKLQLMTAGQISKTTGMGSVGLDFLTEERQKLEEDQMSAEETAAAQKKMEQGSLVDEMAAPPPPGGGQGPAPAQMDPGQAQPGGQPAQGGGQGGQAPPQGQLGPMGQPQGPGGAAASFAANQPLIPNKPTTPEEIQSIAETLALQIQQMPQTQRQSMLLRLKKEDAVIHAMVKSILEDQDRQAASAGKDQAKQQMFGSPPAGGGGAAGGAPQPGAPPPGAPPPGPPKQAAVELPREAHQQLVQARRRLTYQLTLRDVDI